MNLQFVASDVASPPPPALALLFDRADFVDVIPDDAGAQVSRVRLPPGAPILSHVRMRELMGLGDEAVLAIARASSGHLMMRYVYEVDSHVHAPRNATASMLHGSHVFHGTVLALMLPRLPSILNYDSATLARMQADRLRAQHLYAPLTDTVSPQPAPQQQQRAPTVWQHPAPNFHTQ